MAKKVFSGIIAIVLLISCFLTNNVLAINMFYADNDIVFYDPNANGRDECAPTDGTVDSDSADISSSEQTVENREKVGKILASLNFAGNGDQPLNAVQLAAIMGNIEIESKFNPDAAYKATSTTYRGLVQWDESSSRWTGIPDPKDLTMQAEHLKTELDSSYYKKEVGNFWNISNPASIDEATFLILRNYEIAIKNGGGSEAWIDDAAATQYTQMWPERRDAARAIFNQYGSYATGEGKVYDDGCNPMGLKSGGMTLDEAKEFVEVYKSLQPAAYVDRNNGKNPVTIYNINDANGVHGPLANCVAFSQYFVNRYTTKAGTGVEDGHLYAGHLIANGFVDGGNTPAVYSVFSRPAKHTGVVLGIDKENDIMIVGESDYGETLEAGTVAKAYTMSNWLNKYPTASFAYTDGILKEGEFK